MGPKGHYRSPGGVGFARLLRSTESGFSAKEFAESLPDFSKGLKDSPGKGYEILDDFEFHPRYHSRQKSLNEYEPTEEKSDIELPSSINRDFEHLQFTFETWEELEADVDGERQLVSVPEEKNSYIHISDLGHFLIRGPIPVVENSVDHLLTHVGDSQNLQKINFPPDFLLWLLYKHYLDEDISFGSNIIGIRAGSVSDKSEKTGTIHSDFAGDELTEATPLFQSVMMGGKITRLSAQFQTSDLVFGADITQGGRLQIDLPPKLDSYVRENPETSLRIVSHISDLQNHWASLSPEEKYPEPSFFFELYNQADSKEFDIDEVVEEYTLKRNEGIGPAPDYDSEPEQTITNPRSEELFDGTTLGDALEIVESQRIEAKVQMPSTSRDIAKEVAALANHKGGALILGMDDGGTLVGLGDVRETDERVAGVVTQNIEPPVDIEILQRSVGDADLLIIVVKQIDDTPRSVDGVYYKRVGTTVQEMSPEELAEMIRS